MATADSVNGEVMGTNDSRHVTTVWKNVAAWIGAPRSLQDKVSRVARELLEEASYTYDVGRDGAARNPLGIRNAIFRVLHEVTAWIPRRSAVQLEAKRDAPDTVLGHAADAASYGQLNNELLKQILAKLNG